MRAAQRRQGRLTKPTGALGRLEELAIRVAGIQQVERPRLGRGEVIVFAADHGVAAYGVSAYPPAVTAQMVRNFLSGGAAVNVLAGALDCALRIVDVGVAGDLPDDPALHRASLGPGTRDMRTGPAMSGAQAECALEVGIQHARAAAAAGATMIVPGEMGIGNTTAAAAIGCALTGRPPEELVGRGTGVDDAGLARKVAAVRAALATNAPRAGDPLDVLAKVGWFEIGAAAGAILGSAVERLPVVLDGFIVGAAALIAARLAPRALAYCFAGHRSAEAGHRVLLAALGLEPLLDLGMRLGEGTGALLATALLRSACRLHDEMATFDEAGVSDRAR